VVGGLPSEGIQVTATGFRNDADDQVVLHELRSGGDLEVPVSAKARGHIAMHGPDGPRVRDTSLAVTDLTRAAGSTTGRPSLPAISGIEFEP
jgi:hypothetical protein